ncbi:MAG: hypothetical protein AAF713_17550, partial [Pseudomonadota bacterium]
ADRSGADQTRLRGAMIEWDPYYLDRGIRRPLPAERRERQAFTHERVQLRIPGVSGQAFR